MKKATKTVRVLGASALVIGLCAAWSASAQQAPAKRTNSTRIGQFAANNYESLVASLGKSGKSTKVTLTGKNLLLQSPRYDLKSPFVTLTNAGGKVQSAEAKDGARVILRSEDPTQSGVLTSETATYTAATPSKRARIDFPNPVRFVGRDPNLSPDAPLDLQAKFGSVEFVDEDTYLLKLGPGTATATTVEPTAKPKAKP
jgi:hypothetical protein